jgi:membrane protein DedA with SNARE-associated domain
MELINDLYTWLSALPPLGVYGVLLAIAYAENLLPPVPGDVAIVVAGMVAATGAASLPVVIALAAAGGAFGFLTVYALGRRLDEALLEPGRFRWLPKGDIRKAEAYVARHGYVIVAANRFMPGVRAVIGLTVGMSHLPVGRVAVFAAFSAVAWSALLASLGFALVDNRAALARVMGGVERVGAVLTVLLVVALAAWVVRVVRRRRRGAAGAG